ncbi:hypothetical protein QLX67_01780 [Balneolaceae bacterium ANBcel3]|nr:hypothetical protein [Balneolaceae bacterium ANBcel3]
MVVLFAACLAGFFLLFFTPHTPANRLHSLAEADSLIQQELAFFNVPDDRIRTRNHTVNDDFTRIHYTVNVPAGISKTHLHAQMAGELRRYKVETIGRMNVPRQELSLYFYYSEKLIRSMTLRTDPDYARIPHPAYISFYFDRTPSASVIERMDALNIPYQIVLQSDSHRRISRWMGQLDEEGKSASLWLPDSPPFEEWEHSPSIIRAIEAFSEFDPSPSLLLFSSLQDISGYEGWEEGALQVDWLDFELLILDGSSFLIIESEDRHVFDQKLLYYSRLAREAGTPHLLLPATEPVLDWLDEWIPRIQRGGVLFRKPTL